MRWPWDRNRAADAQPTVRKVTDASAMVNEKARELRGVAAELDAAAELISRNAKVLISVAGDRRHRHDTAYAGPERRGGAR